MTVFKCKMCGGSLEINNSETVATCEYCGTQQTLPSLEDEKCVNLYDRANHFRRNNEFDKAMGIYEQILNENSTDAEAYWSLVLCRYGIEYVEEPSSHKRVPTVKRSQFTSVFDDDNYKSALHYAKGSQRSIYEKEAKEINEIQKGILAISQKEEPFDVFICYKETDNNGSRTPDSVLANDLYHQLTQEGFKVFFARITLEDKLGSAYEPYIFAALNSSKVMVVLGTKPEFFNAVWVKNEWSRYLALIKQGQKKILIPAYKDMDPYDLPEEFSHLQAQDMSKLGFMVDLIRGIKKILQDDTEKTTTIKETFISAGNANITPLLKRAFMFLEDGDWNSANEYCEKVLDIEPENASAYLGKLMVELEVRKQENLKDCSKPFDGNINYQKIVRFADEKLKSELAGYIEQIKVRNENARIDAIYNMAKGYMAEARTESAYKEAAQQFERVSGYEDSDALAQECYEKAEIARKDAIYTEGISNMTGEEISNYESAIKIFEFISGWKDADDRVVRCQKKIEELKVRAEEERLQRERQEELERKKIEKRKKRNKKIAIIIAFFACIVVTFIIVQYAIIIPTKKKNDFIAKYGQDVYDKFGVFDEGTYITFGTYEQDNMISNGKEDIEWLVLEINEGKILVISKYALDCQPYSSTYANVTWETCTLREWLNDDFINEAFSEEEKEMISMVRLTNYDSSNKSYVTQDKVFLLSIMEANKYFSFAHARKCQSTDYAVANGTYVIEENYCYWWLRSPGSIQIKVSYVDISSGDVQEVGSTVINDYIAVRPALWIDLNS